MPLNPTPQDRQFLEARARRPSWRAGVSLGLSFGIFVSAFEIGNNLYERAGLALQPPIIRGSPVTYSFWLAVNLAVGIIAGLAVIGMIRLWRKFRLLL